MGRRSKTTVASETDLPPLEIEEKEGERTAQISRRFVQETPSEKTTETETTEGEWLSTEQMESHENSEEIPEEKGKLILGKFKTYEDLEKGYRELESAFTRVSQEKAAQRQFYEDLIKSVGNDGSNGKDAVLDDKFTDEFQNMLYENPKEALSKFARVIKNEIINELDSKFLEKDALETVEYIKKTYPDIVKEENYAILDALAAIAPADLKTYRQRYEFAIEKFSELKNKLIEAERQSIQKEIQATEEMKGRAKIASSSAISSEKVYSRSAIRDMMLNRPSEYARLYDDILQAYKEGRVK